jgi:hypothetical protein
MTYQTLQLYHVVVEHPQDQQAKTRQFNNIRFRDCTVSTGMLRHEAMQAQSEIAKATPDAKIYVIEAVSVLIT